MRGDEFGGPIRWRIHVPAPPREVYSALDTDMGRAAFWAELADERSGTIEFRFIDGSTYEARILERRRPKVWAIEYFGGEARFELADDGHGGTDLTLTHSGVPEDRWADTHAGWLNVLLPLKAWLMTGIDIRNHDRTRRWDDGYADQ